MEVFSRNFFAYPTSSQDAKTIAEVITIILTKHAYLPSTLFSDKGWFFMSNVNKEVAGVFEIILMHATTKHAQTIGMLEWSHAAIVQALNIQTGQRRSLCHKYVSIAVLNYNTSYHVSIGCEPSRFFHGRIPYEVPDLKMGFRLEKTPVHQVHQLLKTSSNRRKRFSKTLAKMPRKLISNTKRTMIRKITRQNLNEKIMSTFWSLKQTSLQNFVGLSLRILKSSTTQY